MRYTLDNGKAINIPDAEIENNMKFLEVDREDAIQIWLEDNDYAENEEQEALDETASKVKLNLGAKADAERKPAKERTKKISDEKKALFETILHNIDRCEGVEKSDVIVLNENKLIQVSLGGKVFKIDLIETRPKKK